ncbi:MAG: hypothetical protein KAS66_05470 [Candidatus Omnitrophica bacterium]|nr:hypothetical protein [Candidatus Omnitrophota bacterium]
MTDLEAVRANKDCIGPNMVEGMCDEIEQLRGAVSGLADMVTGEGMCAKLWTGVKCEGCECGDKNYE